MAKKSSPRLTITDDPSGKVGHARYEIYKEVIDQYKKAMDNSFYIEAIALMESLISDRLESHLNSINPLVDYSFSTIGYLANQLKDKHVHLVGKMQDTLNKISQWAKERNNAIHQMAKFPDNNYSSSFQERYQNLKKCAVDGYVLFSEYNTELTQLRNKLQKSMKIYRLKSNYSTLNIYPCELHIMTPLGKVFVSENGKESTNLTYYIDEMHTIWPQTILDMYYDVIE